MALNFEDAPRVRYRCKLRPCSQNRMAGFPFCEGHWDALPEDLRYRLEWAAEEGTGLDRAAALNASLDYLGENT